MVSEIGILFIMVYKYREIECPKCAHIFMWSDAERTNESAWYEYRLKDKDGLLSQAKCPQCGAGMALQTESKLGISIEDKRLVKGVFRGL